VGVQELLDDWHCGVLKLDGLLGKHLLNFSDEVEPDVLVADVLEHFPGQLAAFVSLRVNEMAEVAAGASGGPVEVAAGNCAVVAGLDELVGVRGRVGCCRCQLELVR